MTLSQFEAVTNQKVPGQVRPVGDEIVVEIVPDIRDLAGVKHALVFFALS